MGDRDKTIKLGREATPGIQPVTAIRACVVCQKGKYPTQLGLVAVCKRCAYRSSALRHETIERKCKENL